MKPPVCFWIIASVIVAVAPCVALWPAPRVEASAHHPGFVVSARRDALPPRVRGRVHLALSGSHYLFVDDGSCPQCGEARDRIESYRITGSGATLLQTFKTDANQAAGYFGSTTLALRPRQGKQSECLILTDAAGYVDSFSVNGATQLITAEVSHLADPVLGGQTEDVQVSSNGLWAYVADDTASLTSWSIGTSCALTPGNQSTGGTGREEYINLALATPTRLVTTDAGASAIDTYSLSSSGGITLLKSVTAQPGVTADGIAVSPSTLFTGSLTGYAQVEGGSYVPGTGAVNFMRGSPASDRNATLGIPLFYDAGNQTVIEGDDFGQSALSNYTVSGSPSRLKFSAETPLAHLSEYPDDLTQLGSTLIVDGVFFGDIEACTLGATGASGCTTLVVLSDPYGASNGLAIL